MPDTYALAPLFAALAVFAILMVVIIDNSGYAGKLHRAQHEAQGLCRERYGAVTYDVQDQEKMVYACRLDGKLHVIDYSSY